MNAVRLDDGQIERYSRQIVLPEIGATGQSRLLDARVTVLGDGAAAGAIVAQLAAAGVGRIAAPADLHAYADPDHTARLAATDASPGAADVLVVVESATDSAPRTLWLQDGRIGATPPCVDCAAHTLPATTPCPPELAFAQGALLGALLATEAIKQIVDIDTTLAGNALTYDPTTADVTVTAVTPDPTCTTCASATREG